MKTKRSLVHPPPALVVFLRKARISMRMTKVLYWLLRMTDLWDWNEENTSDSNVWCWRFDGQRDLICKMRNKSFQRYFKTSPASAATTPDLKGFEASVKVTSVGSFQSIDKLAIKRNRMQPKAKDGKAILDTFAISNLNLFSTNVTHLVWNKLWHRNTKWDAIKIR